MSAASNNGKTLSLMRLRITLEQPQLTSDTGGGYTRTWQPFASAWAHIAPLRGQEEFAGLQLTGVVTHRITMRYITGVTSAMRVLYGARAFNIRAVMNPDERKEYLVMVCDEGVAV